jgi:hypothetical protein
MRRDGFRTTPPTVRSHATRTRIQLCLCRRTRRRRRGTFSFTSLLSDPLPFLSFFDTSDAVSDPDSFAEAAVPSPSPDDAAPPPLSKPDARGATGVGGAGPAADRPSSAPLSSWAAAPSPPPAPMDSLAAEGQGWARKHADLFRRACYDSCRARATLISYFT